MRKRKKKRRDPKVHAQRSQATALNAEKIRRRDYNIICRERRETSRSDVNVGKNMPAEHPTMPTETILDPWEMAFCPSIRTKVCLHTTIFRLDHDTFYISLFFIS